MTAVAVTDDVLAAELAAAARDLTAAAGNASLCTMSRSSGSVPAAKYHEGRCASLREVSRASTPDPSTRLAAARRERQVWGEALARDSARSTGSDWITYRAGGVDALDRLVALLTQVDRDRS